VQNRRFGGCAAIVACDADSARQQQHAEATEMITPTHMLVAGALVGRPTQRPWQLALAWFGGFFPDMSVFVMVILARTGLVTADSLWRQPAGLYWQEPWQSFSAISNSMPLYALLIGIGWIVWRGRFVRWRPAGLGLLLFAAAALLHVLLDFPVHTDDAHVHFWPFSDWRFHSPVSYYQRDHYGDIVGTIEAIVGIGLAAYIVWRFRSWKVRLCAALLVFPYALNLGFLF
jgi:hypothetical protein